MTELSGNLSEVKSTAVLGEIFGARRTGQLRLRRDEMEEEWSFVSGELYLPMHHRLVSAFQSLEGARTEATSDALSDSGFSWVELAVAALQRWSEGQYEFVEGAGGIGTDLFGPLPTASVVMEGTVQGLTDFELLRILGGEEQSYVATKDSHDWVDLDPQEAFFLSRLDHPSPIKELLSLSDLDRESALEKLCRLRSVNLIHPETKKEDEAVGKLLSPKLLTSFSDRIAASLEKEAVDLEPQAHRQKIASLLGRLGTLTFFELLGVKFGASTDDIHDQYTQLARLVHPSNANHLELEGKEAGLQLLFERATEAYLTLSDDDRSRDYVMEVGGAGGGGVFGPSEEERRNELESLAEQYYAQARVMEARGDNHFAIELLQQAVRNHPRAEYFALLGSCQARNPQWVGKAVASFTRAVELDPEDGQIRFQLAQALEVQGRPGQAREQYSAALEKAPALTDASVALARLREDGKKKKRKGKRAKAGGGLLSRILGRSSRPADPDANKG